MHLPSLPRVRTAWPALLIALLAACESPTRPEESTLLRPGQATSGTLARNEVRELTLEVTPGDSFAVYVRAPEGEVSVTVRESVTGRLAAAARNPGGDTASTRWFAGAVVSNGAPYIVSVTTTDPDGASFTLRPEVIVTAPERTAPALAVGAIVSDEGLQHPLDVDEFTFELASPTVVILHLQADVLEGDIWADMSLASGLGAHVVAPAGPLTDPEGGSSGSTLLQPGTYRIRIAQRPRGRPAVAYRLHLRAIDLAPERAPALLVPGDTLAVEAIDHVGDIDQFVLRGAPGEEFNLFVDASGEHGHAVAVELALSPNHPRVGAEVGGAKLLDNPIGRFAIPAAGEVRVSVSGWSDRVAGQRGPYRLFVLPVDPSPEGRAATIAPDGAVLESALEVHGDVDEYAFVLDAPRRVALRHPLVEGGPVIDLLAAGAATPLPAGRDTLLSAGAHRVRVRSTGLRTGFRGSYRFALSQVDTLPEGVPVALAIRDTVRSSAAWPWDIDTYELTTSALDTILVALDTDDGDPLELVQATLVNAATGARIPLSPDHVIGYARVELPAGRYALRVEWRSDRWAPGTRADYAVAVRRVSAAPESHTIAIALADTVRETSGFMGDIDDFVLEATPGQLVNVAFGNPGGLPVPLMFTLSDAATGTVLTRRGGQFPVQYTAPVQVPASGAIRVRVCVPDDCLWYGEAGPYWLVALPIDRSPESRAATFAIGDVVQGEAIERPGDLDEFTFTAGAGATITVLFEGWPVGPEPLRLEVVDPQDGTVLGHVDRNWLANDSPPSELGLTLPRAGTWMVRVQAMPNAWGHEGHGAYRFRVVAR